MKHTQLKQQESAAMMMWAFILVAGCAGLGDVATVTSATTDAQGAVASSSVALATRSTAAASARDSAVAGSKKEAASQRTLRPDDFKGLPWRSVGPANMGGRVAAITLTPSDPNTFYVGFATGGLFKTTNNGTTFTPLFDKEATASIGAIAVADAPADWPGWSDDEETAPDERADKGKGKIVWVGTGEGNGRNSSSWGHGVYRSTDAGATFKNVGLIDSRNIPAIAVDPRNPDVCYVAALGHLWGSNELRGVYKTEDGGKTWQAVLQISDKTGACDVIIDPSDPDTVFAAMYQRRRTAWSFQGGGADGGVFRSTDAGATWTKLTNGLPKLTGRIGLDIFRKDSSIMYVLIESDEGGTGVGFFDNRSRSGGVFRSEDHGDTWTRMSNLAPRSFYFSRIRIDPGDDQRIYLPAWGLGISSDGGRTFRAGGARKPHVDMHAMAIDPTDTDRLIIGTDGGLYMSYDAAKTWRFFNQIATGEFYNIAVDNSQPYRIAGGLQDNGSWVGPSASQWVSSDETLGEPGAAITNGDWRFVFSGDGFHVAFDPSDRDIIYAESQGGMIGRINLATGRRTIIQPSPKEGEPRFRFNWNAPFFISPHDPTTLYLGGSSVFKLTDRGDHWERLSDDLSRRDITKITTVGSDAETHGTVVSLAESAIKKGMIWAGTDDGLIHLTTDDGKVWKDVTPDEVGGYYISSIEPSRHERDTAYVAVDGHRSDDMTPSLLVTTDAGATWRSIAGDLPDGWPVKVVREDRRNPDVLYVGVENAAYVTIDRGQHWVKMNASSLPTVAVDDIAQQSQTMDLIAGTHGRSIYVLDGASCVSQLTPDVLEADLHLFEIAPVTPQLFLPNAGVWGDQIFAAKNPPEGASIIYWLRDFVSDEVSISIEDANGTLVRKLTGANRPGFNRVAWDLQPDERDRYNTPDTQLGQKQFVPAGDYTVTITIGKMKTKGTITVGSAPR